MPSDQLMAEAKSLGISEATLKRAKARRKGTDGEIKSVRPSSGNDGKGRWVWQPARTRAGDNQT